MWPFSSLVTLRTLRILLNLQIPQVLPEFPFNLKFVPRVEKSMEAMEALILLPVQLLVTVGLNT